MGVKGIVAFFLWLAEAIVALRPLVPKECEVAQKGNRGCIRFPFGWRKGLFLHEISSCKRLGGVRATVFEARFPIATR